MIGLYDVSNSVVENVKKYLTEMLPEYNLVRVVRKSSHPLDSQLYMVVARRNIREEYKRLGAGEFAVWTCWNESTQCLNYGHYDIKTETEAMELVREYFYN